MGPWATERVGIAKTRFGLLLLAFPRFIFPSHSAFDEFHFAKRRHTMDVLSFIHLRYFQKRRLIQLELNLEIVPTLGTIEIIRWNECFASASSATEQYHRITFHSGTVSVVTLNMYWRLMQFKYTCDRRKCSATRRAAMTQFLPLFFPSSSFRYKSKMVIWFHCE